MHNDALNIVLMPTGRRDDRHWQWSFWLYPSEWSHAKGRWDYDRHWQWSSSSLLNKALQSEGEMTGTNSEVVLRSPPLMSEALQREGETTAIQWQWSSPPVLSEALQREGEMTEVLRSPPLLALQSENLQSYGEAKTYSPTTKRKAIQLIHIKRI